MTKRRALAWGGAVVAIAAISVAAFVPTALEPRSQALGPEYVSVGDHLDVGVRIFDAENNSLLYSTFASDREDLATSNQRLAPDFVIPDRFHSLSYEVNATNIHSPIPGTNASVPLNEFLLGRQVGATVVIPIEGRMPGYNTSISLDRVRGPFNSTQTMPLEVLQALTNNLTAAFDGVIPYRVISSSENNVTISLGLHDGDELPIGQTGLHAVVSKNNSEVFSWTLSGSVGQKFSLTKSCWIGRFVLPPGSYQVQSINASEIRLTKSITMYPQFIDRPLNMEITIIDDRGKEKGE